MHPSFLDSDQLVSYLFSMTGRIKDPIATRARIMRSAGEEYCRMGIQAARLNAIVEKSGITKGSLFHHFSGKDDLALQWIKETLPDLLRERWSDRVEKAADPSDALKEVLQQSVRACEQASEKGTATDFMATLIASVHPGDASLHQAILEIQRSWHLAVSEALQRGQGDQLVHSAIVASDEAHFILSLILGCELQVKAMGAAATTGWLRSGMAYLDTLRPA